MGPFWIASCTVMSELVITIQLQIEFRASCTSLYTRTWMIRNLRMLMMLPKWNSHELSTTRVITLYNFRTILLHPYACSGYLGDGPYYIFVTLYMTLMFNTGSFSTTFYSMNVASLSRLLLSFTKKLPSWFYYSWMYTCILMFM